MNSIKERVKQIFERLEDNVDSEPVIIDAKEIYDSPDWRPGNLFIHDFRRQLEYSLDLKRGQ